MGIEACSGEASMRSLIKMLHDHIGATLSTDTRSPITADGMLFDYQIAFPGQQNFRRCDILMLQVEVEDCGEDGYALEVQLRRIPRRHFKTLWPFFKRVDKKVDLFLQSFFYSKETDGWQYMPEGWLYPRMRERGFITPTFGMTLPFESDSSPEEIFRVFRNHLSFACGAIWLAAPILKFVEKNGREPTKAEYVRLLSIAHGTIQVLSSDEGCSRENPPIMHLPAGFYSSLYSGDAVHLRTQ
jgi:hypothetical protein